MTFDLISVPPIRSKGLLRKLASGLGWQPEPTSPHVFPALKFHPLSFTMLFSAEVSLYFLGDSSPKPFFQLLRTALFLKVCPIHFT